MKNFGGQTEILVFINMKKKKRISRRPYWKYAIFRDGKTWINRRPYWNYVIIEMKKKIEFPGGDIEIMLFIEIENLEFPGGHIESSLFIEME